MKQLKMIKRIYSTFSISLIILGMVFLLRPGPAADVFSITLGVMLILFGIVKLFGYFSRDLLQLAFQFDFAMGIISCLIGLTILIRPTHLLDKMFIAIGFFMLADALLRIQTVFDAKKIGVSRWWLILGVALVTAVTGALLFMKPYVGTKALMMLIGTNLIIDGILNLIVVQSTVATIRRKKEWEA